MHGYDLEGADRVTTVGASDITMRIWNELSAAGEEGLTRDEILERVGPHINRGYARRRYLKRRRSAHEATKGIARMSAIPLPPSWDDTELEPALAYVVRTTLQNMYRDSSAIRQPSGRYSAGRRPRHRDPSIIDMTGDRTRLHMNGAEALRLLEPAWERHSKSFRAQLTAEEWAALGKLITLYKEQMRLGF